MTDRNLVRTEYGTYYGAPAVLERWSDGSVTVCQIQGPDETTYQLYEREIAFAVEQTWKPLASVEEPLRTWLAEQQAKG